MLPCDFRTLRSQPICILSGVWSVERKRIPLPVDDQGAFSTSFSYLLSSSSNYSTLLHSKASPIVRLVCNAGRMLAAVRRCES